MLMEIAGRDVCSLSTHARPVYRKHFEGCKLQFRSFLASIQGGGQRLAGRAGGAYSDGKNKSFPRVGWHN